MTAQEQTCYTLICDGCSQVVYDDGEGRENHFDSAEALRFDATEYGEWSQDGDRDLCPACTCAAAGHRQRIGSGGWVECTRCYETLLDSITTATPKAAYL